MHLEFELVTYNEALDTFELDETMYQVEISEEDFKNYEVLKASDMVLYDWLKESTFFINHVRENVYPDSQDRKIAISDIHGTTYRRFFFFKVTSGDSHYEYFKKLFNIFEESDWQDREEIGHEILTNLKVKRKELIIDLNSQIAENDAQNV